MIENLLIEWTGNVDLYLSLSLKWQTSTSQQRKVSVKVKIKKLRCATIGLARPGLVFPQLNMHRRVQWLTFHVYIHFSLFGLVSITVELSSIKISLKLMLLSLLFPFLSIVLNVKSQR